MNKFLMSIALGLFSIVETQAAAHPYPGRDNEYNTTHLDEIISHNDVGELEEFLGNNPTAKTLGDALNLAAARGKKAILARLINYPNIQHVPDRELDNTLNAFPELRNAARAQRPAG